MHGNCPGEYSTAETPYETFNEISIRALEDYEKAKIRFLQFLLSADVWGEQQVTERIIDFHLVEKCRTKFRAFVKEYSAQVRFDEVEEGPRRYRVYHGTVTVNRISKQIYLSSLSSQKEAGLHSTCSDPQHLLFYNSSDLLCTAPSPVTSGAVYVPYVEGSSDALIGGDHRISNDSQRPSRFRPPSSMCGNSIINGAVSSGVAVHSQSGGIDTMDDATPLSSMAPFPELVTVEMLLGPSPPMISAALASSILPRHDSRSSQHMHMDTSGSAGGMLHATSLPANAVYDNPLGVPPTLSSVVSMTPDILQRTASQMDEAMANRVVYTAQSRPLHRQPEITSGYASQPRSDKQNSRRHSIDRIPRSSSINRLLSDPSRGSQAPASDAGTTRGDDSGVNRSRSDVSMDQDGQDSSALAAWHESVAAGSDELLDPYTMNPLPPTTLGSSNPVTRLHLPRLPSLSADHNYLSAPEDGYLSRHNTPSNIHHLSQIPTGPRTSRHHSPRKSILSTTLTDLLSRYSGQAGLPSPRPHAAPYMPHVSEYHPTNTPYTREFTPAPLDHDDHASSEIYRTSSMPGYAHRTDLQVGTKRYPSPTIHSPAGGAAPPPQSRPTVTPLVLPRHESGGKSPPLQHASTLPTRLTHGLVQTSDQELADLARLLGDKPSSEAETGHTSPASCTVRATKPLSHLPSRNSLMSRSLNQEMSSSNLPTPAAVHMTPPDTGPSNPGGTTAAALQAPQFANFSAVLHTMNMFDPVYPDNAGNNNSNPPAAWDPGWSSGMDTTPRSSLVAPASARGPPSSLPWHHHHDGVSQQLPNTRSLPLRSSRSYSGMQDAHSNTQSVPAHMLRAAYDSLQYPQSGDYAKLISSKSALDKLSLSYSPGGVTDRRNAYPAMMGGGGSSNTGNVMSNQERGKFSRPSESVQGQRNSISYDIRRRDEHALCHDDCDGLPITISDQESRLSRVLGLSDVPSQASSGRDLDISNPVPGTLPPNGEGQQYDHSPMNTSIFSSTQPPISTSMFNAIHTPRGCSTLGDRSGSWPVAVSDSGYPMNRSRSGHFQQPFVFNAQFYPPHPLADIPDPSPRTAYHQQNMTKPAYSYYQGDMDQQSGGIIEPDGGTTSAKRQRRIRGAHHPS